jgi:fluoride exporter
MNLVVWCAVILIGGAGSVLRFVVDGTVTSLTRRDFPLGTLVVNISGAFALGLVGGLALAQTQALLVGTAAVGSYTTFSTWVLESQRLSEEREHRAMLANLVLSLVFGVGAAALGTWVGERT